VALWRQAENSIERVVPRYAYRLAESGKPESIELMGKAIQLSASRGPLLNMPSRTKRTSCYRDFDFEVDEDVAALKVTLEGLQRSGCGGPNRRFPALIRRCSHRLQSILAETPICD
jgi:hypothetical protein